MGEVEWMKGYDPVAAGEQAEDGTDLEGIRYNLTLTVAQRIEQHRQGLSSLLFLEELRDAPGLRTDRRAPG